MDNNLLSQKIKTLRIGKNLSQEGLAQMARVSHRTIHRIEKENRKPSGDTLKRISAALEVSPDYFMEQESNEKSYFLLILAVSPIFFILNPILAILVPLTLWLIKMNTIKEVKELGIKILIVQSIWVVLYFAFTISNFIRLKAKIINAPNVFVGDEIHTYFSDFNSQLYIKIIFTIVNIIIILNISYRTFTRTNQTSISKTYNS